MDEDNELKLRFSIMPWFQETVKGVSDLAVKLVTEHGMPTDAAEKMVRDVLSGDLLSRAIYFQ